MSLWCYVSTQTESWHKLEEEKKTLEEDCKKWQQKAGELKDLLKQNVPAAKLIQQESENRALKEVWTK